MLCGFPAVSERSAAQAARNRNRLLSIDSFLHDDSVFVILLHNPLKVIPTFSQPVCPPLRHAETVAEAGAMETESRLPRCHAGGAVSVGNQVPLRRQRRFRASRADRSQR